VYKVYLYQRHFLLQFLIVHDDPVTTVINLFLRYTVHHINQCLQIIIINSYINSYNITVSVSLQLT